MIEPRVLFLRSGNSCRTQMAKGLLRDLAGDRFEMVSAGDETAPLDPDGIEAMRELDIDISGHQPKGVNPYLGRRFTFVVTLCERPKRPAATTGYEKEFWPRMDTDGHEWIGPRAKCLRC